MEEEKVGELWVKKEIEFWDEEDDTVRLIRPMETMEEVVNEDLDDVFYRRKQNDHL